MTNNDDIKQCFKKFHNDDTKKGSLITIPKVSKGSLMMILKKFKKVL